MLEERHIIAENYDFLPEDFEGEGLPVSFHSPLKLLVESGHGKEPHVVTHDGIMPTACDEACNWYFYRVKPYLDEGEMPTKFCAHMLRAQVVLHRRHLRQKSATLPVMQGNATGSHNPDAVPLQKKPFNLLKK